MEGSLSSGGLVREAMIDAHPDVLEARKFSIVLGCVGSTSSDGLEDDSMVETHSDIEIMCKLCVFVGCQQARLRRFKAQENCGLNFEVLYTTSQVTL